MIEFLHVLFHLHPFNTCQISHIEPLVRVYRGTLSTSDLHILSIFQLFEEQRKLSVAALFSRWSSSPNATSHSALEALQSLDPIIVLRTCLNFPRWRPLEVQSSTNAEPQGTALYDPFFVMLLFSQMLSEQPPMSALSWIELFRTNIVSLFIRALSAKDGRTRDYALCQIVALWKHMEVRIFVLLFGFLLKVILDGRSPRKVPCAIYPLSHQRSLSTFRHARPQFEIPSPAAYLHDTPSHACFPRNLQPIQLPISYYRPFSPPTSNARYNRCATSLRNALQQFR